MRTRAGARRAALVVLAAWVTGLVGMGVQALAQDRMSVATTPVTGPITPVVADHLESTIATAAAAGHEALVVTLDTPGGLVSSMRDIVQEFLGAPLPIVVYVSPRGADAGSAGTFITLAAHIAAMAPATTIGAATPVDLEGGEVGDKIVENAAAYARTIAEERGRDVEFAVDAVRDGRSITSSEALEIGAIDLIAPDVESLLDEIHGTTVEVDGADVALRTRDATIVPIEMSGVRRVLQRLADPNLAFIFLSLGTLAIIYEVASPGLGAGGILGAVFLILAMFSLAVLPVNYAAAALLVLAAALFIVELFIPGVGVGAAGGTIALLLGGLFLFQEPTGLGIDLWVLVPTALAVFGMVVLAGILVQRSRGRVSHVASDALIGREGRVRSSDERPPRVVLDGTYWRVRAPRADLELHDGDEVTVIDRDNLELIVVPSKTLSPGARPDITDVPPSPTTQEQP